MRRPAVPIVSFELIPLICFAIKSSHSFADCVALSVNRQCFTCDAFNAKCSLSQSAILHFRMLVLLSDTAIQRSSEMNSLLLVDQ